MRIEVGGIGVELLAERGALRGVVLFVADLHLGKSETFRAAGAPVPGGDADEQLARLDRLVERTRAERVVVLGDLLHAASGLTDELVERVASWRRRRRWGMSVVRGNHDRAIDAVSGAWDCEVLEPGSVLDGLELVHDPEGASGRHPWIAGHVHPSVRIGGRANAMKLPCFHVVGGRGLVLPAFSRFTGGANVSARSGDRVVGVAEERLIEVGVRGEAGSVSLGHAGAG